MALDPTDSLPLITYVEPKVIDLAERRFDSLASVVDMVSEGEDVSNHPEVKVLTRRWKKRDGELCQILTTLVYNGRQHSTFKDAEWMAEVGTAANAIHVEPRHSYVDHEHAKMLADRQALLAQRAQKLSEHHLFKEPKPTNGKINTYQPGCFRI